MKFGKYIQRSVNNDTIDWFVNTLYQSVNTLSNVMYTIQGPMVIYRFVYGDENHVAV